MNKKLINSQLTNLLTYQKVRRKMITLASNVLLFKDLDKKAPYIDQAYINKKLVYNGSIAWFMDEELGLLALPYQTIGSPDLYGRPVTIMVQGANGYHRELSVANGEAIIMYDNEGKYPLILDILQDAERIALCKRVQDTNIAQQKTARVWLTDKSREKTVKDLLNRVDGNVENVMAYDTLDINSLTSVLSVAPYITNDIDEHLRVLWEEFYAHIGISSVIIDKKERLIKDEMKASQGGTIASRYSRFNSRKVSLTKIKEKWGIDIELEYYDGIPTTEEVINDTKVEEEKEVVIDE